MSSRRDIGGRIRPSSFDAILTVLLKACAAEIAKRDLKPRQLARLYGCSSRRAEELIAGIDGRGPDLGLEVACRLVECLDATVQVLVEPKTKSLPRLAAPSMVPALADLSRQVAA